MKNYDRFFLIAVGFCWGMIVAFVMELRAASALSALAIFGAVVLAIVVCVTLVTCGIAAATLVRTQIPPKPEGGESERFIKMPKTSDEPPQEIKTSPEPLPPIALPLDRWPREGGH